MGKIEIIQGSVVYAKADAIVNAANESLLGGGGVDGAIHEKAGIELYNECKTLHGCKPGEAKITKAYNIKNAKHIIHTVGPRYYSDSNPKETLKSCYVNCLNLAKENGCKSIAFCCISVGVFAYPLDKATKIALETTKQWLDENPDLDVYFYCYSQREYDMYTSMIKNI